MSMADCSTSSSSSYINHATDSVDMVFIDGNKDSIYNKPKLEFKSKIGQIIFSDLFKELLLSPFHIGLYSDKGSELFDESFKISYYYKFYRTTPGSGNMLLQYFDVCIIDDVIDKMESMMQKGNIIKEALQSLCNDRKPPCLIIFSKESSKEELESIALFAGATKIIEAKCLKDLEHACIVVI